MAVRNVIVAVDASDHSKGAFEWFLENLYRPEDQVIVCHVPETPNLPSISLKEGLALPVDEWRSAIEKQLEKIRCLETDYESTLASRKMKYKVVTHNSKRPGEGIIEVCEQENASVVVMGTRGLDRVRRTLLGSVSDYVVRHSSVPVVICPKAR